MATHRILVGNLLPELWNRVHYAALLAPLYLIWQAHIQPVIVAEMITVRTSHLFCIHYCIFRTLRLHVCISRTDYHSIMQPFPIYVSALQMVYLLLSLLAISNQEFDSQEPLYHHLLLSAVTHIAVLCILSETSLALKTHFPSHC